MNIEQLAFPWYEPEPGPEAAAMAAEAEAEAAEEGIELGAGSEDELSGFDGKASENNSEPEPTPEKTAGIGRNELRQAVLGFLAARGASALAAEVRLHRLRGILGAAATVIEPAGKKRLNRAKSVTVVEFYTDRSACLPDCADHDSMLEKLRELEQRKLEFEAAIRRDEPYLKISGDLFADGECANYDYRASKIHPYAALLRTIERSRHNLFRGSRMENIRRANSADFLYLAVPENLVEPHELAPGWGLIYVMDDLSCVVAAEAPCQREYVSDAARNHLALNIARAAMDNVMLANGVRFTGEVEFFAIPRRRRSRR